MVLAVYKWGITLLLQSIPISYTVDSLVYRQFVSPVQPLVSNAYNELSTQKPLYNSNNKSLYTYFIIITKTYKKSDDQKNHLLLN